MGLDVKSLKHAEIEYLKQNVVILWGEAYKMLHRTLESRPRRLPRKQAALPFLKHHLSNLPGLTRRYEPIKLVMSYICVTGNQQNRWLRSGCASLIPAFPNAGTQRRTRSVHS
jgi:hypothetical protein